MACAGTSTIVQRAHGVGSATFPNPTTAENMLIIASIYAGNPLVGVLQATDDSGFNLYDVDGDGQRSSSTFLSTCDIQYTTTNLGSGCLNGIRSARTITAHWTNSSAPYVWIWEIQGTELNVCLWDWNNDGGAASNAPIGSGLFGNPFCTNSASGCSGSYPAGADCFFNIALCGVSGDGGSVTSVDAPWTLEPLQGGNAAAYNIETDVNATDTVQFHTAANTKWVVKENGYASIFLQAPAFCGCMASPIVGNPLID